MSESPHRMVLLTLAITIQVVLAGCAASAPKAGPATETPGPITAPAATFSTETGGVTGTVTNDQLVPLASVDVQLGQEAFSLTSTDTAGVFTFSHVAPGSHVLFASRPGYVGASARVEVLPGEVARVQMVLQEISVAEPRQSSFVDDGFIQLVLAVGAGFVNLGSQAALGTNKVEARHDAEAGNVETVATLVWDPSTAISAKWMYLDLVHDPAKENRSVGQSPLTKRVGNLTIEKPTTTHFRFMVSSPCVPARPSPDCANDFPTRLVQVVYEQRVKLYSTFFYVDPAPPGYSAAPDG